MASIIAGAAHTAHSTAASLLSSAQIHPGKTLPPLNESWFDVSQFEGNVEYLFFFLIVVVGSECVDLVRRGKGEVNVPLKVILSLPAEFSSVAQTFFLETNSGRLNLTMHGQFSTYSRKTYLSVETLRRLEPPSNMEDNGSLEQVWINVLEHLNSAPSVGMQDVPRESLLEHDI
ncbi:hypothetical protein ARMGADRAFT_1161633 [Armillaria gallica]|uniref:Uncharacterized protein n=1 Tax=Armillaria gallica TaxID=47427 RepID=A0A2H3EF74_ARMGA|nr:hypothetical protein ARMGADRAFT_1161633 [Armillaria gallica]